jgi:hypothetical protein
MFKDCRPQEGLIRLKYPCLHPLVSIYGDHLAWPLVVGGIKEFCCECYSRAQPFKDMLCKSLSLKMDWAVVSADIITLRVVSWSVVGPCCSLVNPGGP